MSKTQLLYGISVGDKVQYIGNDEKKYNKSLFDIVGVVTEIVPNTGEFKIATDNLPYKISFLRHDIVEENYKKDEVEFNGSLVDATSITSSELRYYLNNLHEMKEGNDFSISKKDNKVYMSNAGFSSLLQNLFTLQKVNSVLTDEKSKDFKQTFGIYNDNGAVSVGVQLSNWIFSTHLSPFTILNNYTKTFDIDLFKEWGFDGES